MLLVRSKIRMIFLRKADTAIVITSFVTDVARFKSRLLFRIRMLLLRLNFFVCRTFILASCWIYRTSLVGTVCGTRAAACMRRYLLNIDARR